MTHDNSASQSGDHAGTSLSKILAMSGRGGAGNRAQQVLASSVLAKEVVDFAHGKYKTWRDKSTYVVSISSTSQIYADVLKWMISLLDTSRQRALQVATSWDESPSRSRKLTMDLLYDGKTSERVTIRGQRVEVFIEQAGTPNNGGQQAAYESYRPMERSVVFRAHSLAAREAVLKELARIVGDSSHRTPKLFTQARWGNEWMADSEAPARKLESVILRAGQLEEIVSSLERFLANEEVYRKLGVPWHQGYLFHGVPGTGKTSTAIALAAHFELDVYYLAVQSVKNDSDLASCLGQVGPRSMLVLEDVDILHGTKARDDSENSGVSMAGLLNALDGMITPHGLITVMTTNNIDVLDPALIRPGRVDVNAHMSYVDDEQLARMVEQFHGQRLELPPVESDITPAEVVDIFKHTIDAPERVESHLKKLLLSSPPVHTDEVAGLGTRRD